MLYLFIYMQCISFIYIIIIYLYIYLHDTDYIDIIAIYIISKYINVGPS